MQLRRERPPASQPARSAGRPPGRRRTIEHVWPPATDAAATSRRRAGWAWPARRYSALARGSRWEYLNSSAAAAWTSGSAVGRQRQQQQRWRFVWASCARDSRNRFAPPSCGQSAQIEFAGQIAHLLLLRRGLGVAGASRPKLGAPAGGRAAVWRLASQFR